MDTTPDVLTKLVADLDLSVRAQNCLQAAGIRHVGELVLKAETELLKTRCFGRKTIVELRAVLAEMGLRIGMRPGEQPSQGPVILRENFADLEQLRATIDAQGELPLSDMERNLVLDLALREPVQARRWLVLDLRRQEKAAKKVEAARKAGLNRREGRSVTAMLLGADPSGYARLLDEMQPDQAPHSPDLQQIETVRDALATVIHSRTNAERVVVMVNGRFGLSGGEPKTFQALGDGLGIGHERVRQVVSETLRRARTAMRAAR